MAITKIRKPGSGPIMPKIKRQSAPLHLDPNDLSQEAELKRLELHQFFSFVRGGAGFREPANGKHSGGHSRRNHQTRIEAIANRSFGSDSV